MCAHAVRVSLKAINGVETVDVSLNKGLATITLKDGNTVTMKQLREAIAKNGFTTKSSNVVAAGQLLEKSGGVVLHASGSNEEFGVVPNGTEQLDRKLLGKTVRAEGTVPEISSGSSIEQLRFRSIAESQ